MGRLLQRMRGESGLTLVELCITMSLLAVVTVPAMNFMIGTQRAERIANEATQQQQGARLAIEQLTRWLRQADYPQGHTYQDSQIFLSANDSDLTFFSDVDDSGINEMVRYWLDSSTASLKRTITVPDCSISPCSYIDANAVATTVTVIQNVRNADLTACSSSGSSPVFTYYKRDPGTLGVYPTPIPTPVGNINDLVDIYYVKVNIVVDVTPGKTPTCQTLTTTVQIRNWKG
jgi:Tfp pilus assembly protein PilW